MQMLQVSRTKMAIETLMMTFGRPKRGGAGHLPRKENNNKLKAAHKQTNLHSLSVCVWEYLCAFPFPARPRKHYKSFLAATCLGLSSFLAPAPAQGLRLGLGMGLRLSAGASV